MQSAVVLGCRNSNSRPMAMASHVRPSWLVRTALAPFHTMAAGSGRIENAHSGFLGVRFWGDRGIWIWNVVLDGRAGNPLAMEGRGLQLEGSRWPPALWIRTHFARCGRAGDDRSRESFELVVGASIDRRACDSLVWPRSCSVGPTVNFVLGFFNGWTGANSHGLSTDCILVMVS